MSDGGPAFPIQVLNEDGEPWKPIFGMSLRDWFAGQALIGLISDGAARPNVTSSVAYEFADAMLKAREAS